MGVMRTSLLLTPIFVLLTVQLTACGASAPPHAAAAPSQASYSATPGGAAQYPSMADLASAPQGAPATERMNATTPAPAMPGAPQPVPPPAAGAKSEQGRAPLKGKDGAPEVAQSLGIIYTGAVAIRAKREEFPRTIDRVVDLAESLGGAITGRTDQSVTVRVPSQAFRKAMSGMEDVGVVENRNVTAQDVGEEMHDLTVRLQNMRATRKRLEEFLAKATNIADTLTVERELERVSVDIDRIEGRLEFLKAHTAFSHITVNLLEKPKDVVAVVVKEPPPPPPPPRKLVEVPAPWFDRVGIDALLKVH
jgi:hypothetical protein